MTEIKTCEQYVLAELERLQTENESLRERVSDLNEETHRSDGGVDVWFGGPVKTVRFSVASTYTIKRNMSITADGIREILSDEKKLEEFADGMAGFFPVLNVEIEEWPFSLESGIGVYACRVDDGRLEIKFVRADASDFSEGELYRASYAGAVHSEGLQTLAEELQELLDDLTRG